MSAELDKELVARIAALERRNAALEAQERGGGCGSIDLPITANIANTAGSALNTTYNIQRLAFDAVSAEYTRWSITVPSDAATNKALSITVIWSTTTANTGTVAWQVLYRATEPGEVLWSSDTTLATQVSAGNHTAWVTQTTTFTTTAIDVSANTVLMIQVARVPGSDTYDADAYVYGVNVRYVKA